MTITLTKLLADIGTLSFHVIYVQTNFVLTGQIYIYYADSISQKGYHEDCVYYGINVRTMWANIQVRVGSIGSTEGQNRSRELAHFLHDDRFKECFSRTYVNSSPFLHSQAKVVQCGMLSNSKCEITT